MFALSGSSASVVSHKQLELFFLIFRTFPHSWSSATGFDFLQGLSAAAKLFDNRLDGCCPDEGLRVGVPGLEKFFDRRFQIINTDKDAPTKAFAS